MPSRANTQPALPYHQTWCSTNPVLILATLLKKISWSDSNAGREADNVYFAQLNTKVIWKHLVYTKLFNWGSWGFNLLKNLLRETKGRAESNLPAKKADRGQRTDFHIYSKWQLDELHKSPVPLHFLLSIRLYLSIPCSACLQLWKIHTPQLQLLIFCAVPSNTSFSSLTCTTRWFN